jgi:hypothetical protein
LGIGNHETIPPKTRDEFVVTFADWLNSPEIREQRLKDDPHDHKVRTYYHWIRDGVDFVNLDIVRMINVIIRNERQSGSLSTMALIDRIAACTEAAASPALKAASATAAVFKCPITASFSVS